MGKVEGVWARLRGCGQGGGGVGKVEGVWARLRGCGQG